MYSKNKIAQTILIVIVVVLAVILAFLLLNKKINSPEADYKKTEDSKENKKEISKKIINTRAKIRSVDLSGVKLASIDDDEDELFFEIPEKGASFVKQTKKENGEFMVEEIGLFSLPINEEVDVQYEYDGEKKELMMITVK